MDHVWLVAQLAGVGQREPYSEPEKETDDERSKQPENPTT
jgi:hypothetical protein